MLTFVNASCAVGGLVWTSRIVPSINDSVLAALTTRGVYGLTIECSTHPKWLRRVRQKIDRSANSYPFFGFVPPFRPIVIIGR